MGREWQFDYGRASETLRRGKPAETGRLYLTSLNHSFTLDLHVERLGSLVLLEIVARDDEAKSLEGHTRSTPWM